MKRFAFPGSFHYHWWSGGLNRIHKVVTSAIYKNNTSQRELELGVVAKVRRKEDTIIFFSDFFYIILNFGAKNHSAVTPNLFLSKFKIRLQKVIIHSKKYSQPRL